MANKLDDIHWLTGAGQAVRQLRCPVCGVTGPHRPVLEVPSAVAPFPLLKFLHCESCGSGQFDPPGVTNFADMVERDDAFWRFYVEVGGGVWETIWPVLAEKTPGRRTLLDVGCGFGFAVDYWQRIHGGEAVGVELAHYGAVGARMLGITVHDRMLQDEPALAGRRFDVVYASEVIEHVPDPGAFVALLANYVAGNGVLVLTTPCREYVEPAQHSLTLHAALSPGFHGFLLSEDALAGTARRAGFAHVAVRRFGERLFLWASRAPLAVDPAPAKLQPTYRAYLEAHAGLPDTTSPVWQGMAYRLIKEYVGANRAAEASALARRLVAACALAFGPQIEDPAAAQELLRKCADLSAVGRVVPYFLPSLYFYLGLIAQHFENDIERAERMFAGAAGCTLAVAPLGHFLEAASLLWMARAALAEIRFARGDIAGGARLYAAIAAAGGACTEENGYAIADRALLESRIPTITENLLAAGHAAAAAEMFAGYRAHVQRQYGAGLLTAPGVATALAAGPAPLDPLFAPAFSAILAQQGRIAAGGAIAGLSALLDIADRWSADPVLGRRMQDHAQRLRRLLPAPRPAAAPTLSYSFTMKNGKSGPGQAP
ncbi:MAG: class I SAM-dependent methyltransferase [Betaproteobacteria bacterium]|nr:class I SAM-dependent methyltransferase [Betaproteobacteria bacterium]